MHDTLDRGRECFARHAWGNAFTQLCAADRETPLEFEDLERLAMAAYLVGRDTDSADVWMRAHNESLRRGDAARAARCAFWLAWDLGHKGELVGSAGWGARGQRLLDDRQLDCVEQGYLRLGEAMQHIFEGDIAAAHASFGLAAKIGDRFGDTDLVTIARMGRGRTLVYMGEIAEGMALLDEVVVAIRAGDVSAIFAGDLYCSVIEACQETFDLRRAQAWTAALSHWCATQPDLVLYRGQCLVHRAELMQLHGEWPDALDEARRAGERLSQPPGQPAVGAAFYQQAEVHRLRGEFAEAEEAYRQANQWGRSPQPGLAQLRLAQGGVDAAQASIRRVVDEAQDRVTRSRVLPAYVEIALAAKDAAAARRAGDELSRIATELDAPLLHALSGQAQGAVFLAEGDPRAALDALRRAWSAYRELDVPYEAARVRVLIGLTYQALGDDDTAAMELDAARWVFQQLGAAPDLARLEELSHTAAPKAAGRLTRRELQVLVLVATGTTNRAIADDLVISEKTVARHVSNIFTKLGLASRSAATAYAYEHGLVSPSA